MFHLVSGDALFSGVAAALVAIGLSCRSLQKRRRLANALMLIGAALVVLSATPIPFWLGGLVMAASAVWGTTRSSERWRTWGAVAAALAWSAVAAVEYPWHRSPQLDPVTTRTITIIGDSVTAGIGRDDRAERWPEILCRRHGVEIQDLSHVGETAASALQRVKRQEITGSLVILEIGGNDLLGRDPSAEQFARDLDALLKQVVAPGRQVVMFELPLPPLYQEFGRVQRGAAVHYDVQLIPRRQFLSVLSAGDATLDSIHLSPSGHRLMAECVWKTAGAGFPDETAASR